MTEALDLLALNAVSPRAPAVALREGDVLSYETLRSRVAGCAASLAWPAKALVIVSEPRSVSGVLGYLAALSAGHAAVLVEEGGPALWTGLIAAFEPDMLIGARGGALTRPAEAAGFRQRDTEPLPVWCRSGPVSGGPIHRELGLLARTSGSLGAPKLVRLSYDNLRSNAEAIAGALALLPADRTVTSLPLDFSFGLSLVNSAFAAGASIALGTYSPSSPLFWQYLDHVQATFAGAVPATYTFLRACGWEQAAHPSLRLLLHAGGALGGETLGYFARQMEERGGSFRSMYGMTEATARMTCQPATLDAAYRGSAGVPVPGGRITIERQDGTPAATGETGEIVFEGPGVMMGYARNRADLTHGDQQGTILRTGDLGYLRDGLLFVTGRRDRQVKVSGRRIDLDQAELQLAGWGVMAAVEAVQGDRLIVAAEPAADLRDACRRLSQALGLPSSSVRLAVIPRLPFNDHGKLDRPAVRRALAEAAS